MKVRALKTGYFNNQRKKEGEVFELTPLLRIVNGKKTIIAGEKRFSNIWMEKIEERPVDVSRKEVNAKPKQEGIPTGDQTVI